MTNVGFGLERLGLLAVSRPIVGGILVLVVSAIAIFGFERLSVSAEFTDLFRKESQDYRNYQALTKIFPGGGGDVFIVVEGDTLLERENLEIIRSLHLDLELVDGVGGVLSMFSVREPPDASGFAPPLFPDALPTGKQYDVLINRVTSHPMVGGKLLAKQKDLTLIVVALEQSTLGRAFRGIVRDLRRMAHEAVEKGGMKATLTGVPVMRREIHKAIKQDRIVYNIGGFAVGAFVSFLFFRSFSAMLIAASAPFAAVIWSFGMFGLVGQKLNVVIVIIAPLVMVISFSDSMHLLFGIRHGLDEGLDKVSAVKRAIRSIGPACVLTSLTTAIALSSLALSDSTSIREFGIYGALSALIAFVAVIVVVPLLSLLLLPNGRKKKDSASFAQSGMTHALYRFSGWLAGAIIPRTNVIAIIGAALLLAATIAQFQLEPSYRLGDYVPDSKQAAPGLARLDRSFGGSQPLHIMITVPKPLSYKDQEVRDAISAAHELFENASSVSNVLSLHSLYGAQDTTLSGTALEKYLDQLPIHLKNRLISPDGRTILVSGRIRDLPSPQARVVIDDLEPPLQRVRAKYSDLEFTLTGLSALAARQSDPLITGLRNSLFVAIILVIVLIGIAFRSLRLALLSFMPNVLPIVASGAALYVAGAGLQIASTVAMTVAFGLAVDDTIHFIHRYRFERKRIGDTGDAITETVRRIGPVLMQTTIVLVLGLSVTLFSAVPSNRLFGELCAVILFVALAADLLLLPALLHIYRKRPQQVKTADADP